MGNTCAGEADNAEIVTGNGQYKYKKSKLAKNEKEQMYYGREKKHYEEIKKNIISRKYSMKRTEASWQNGNVHVITF